MSDTWKGVPPASQHPPGRPFSDKQEARIREIVREEVSTLGREGAERALLELQRSTPAHRARSLDE